MAICFNGLINRFMKNVRNAASIYCRDSNVPNVNKFIAQIAERFS